MASIGYVLSQVRKMTTVITTNFILFSLPLYTCHLLPFYASRGTVLLRLSTRFIGSSTCRMGTFYYRPPLVCHGAREGTHAGVTSLTSASGVPDAGCESPASFVTTRSSCRRWRENAAGADGLRGRLPLVSILQPTRRGVTEPRTGPASPPISGT